MTGGWERRPNGTMVRLPEDPFSAAAIARRAGWVHVDEPLTAESLAPTDPWCPLCGYAMDLHAKATARGVTLWRCPSEAEARAAWGDR